MQLLAFNKEGVDCSCIPSCKANGWVCSCWHSMRKGFKAFAYLVVCRVIRCAVVDIQKGRGSKLLHI